MEKNVGKSDAYIRFITGIAFLLNIFALNTGTIGTIVLLVLGIAMIVSSLTGYCWLYSILNINTALEKSDPPKQQSHQSHH